MPNDDFSSPVIHDVEQGSPEWFALRAGIPTSSQFATVMAKGKNKHGKTSAEASKTRRVYLLKLAGEQLTGEPMETFNSHHMDRGHLLEAEARKLYAFMANADPKTVGFIRNGDVGGSPDALLGDEGLLEVKTKMSHLLIDLIMKNEFPTTHKAQCQGQLWVAEREWLDLAVYWPKLPLFVKRIRRDESYIQRIADAVTAFNEELAEVVATIQRYGGQTVTEPC